MKFENVQIVLVEPTHPGNIGAVARAMKTMCLNRLTVVNPLRFPDPKATALACDAADVLEQARVVPTLSLALADCHVVIGTSARYRGVAPPLYTPRDCAAKVAQWSHQGQVAVLFGRESSGLTNAETDRCNFLVHIPTNPAYSSLNLAAAVQIIAYELRLAASALPTLPSPRILSESHVDQAACAEDVANFYTHLEQVLLEIGFLNPVNPRPLMRRLHRLFNRTQLDKREVNILRGILSAVQGRNRPSDH